MTGVMRRTGNDDYLYAAGITSGYLCDSSCSVFCYFT